MVERFDRSNDGCFWLGSGSWLLNYVIPNLRRLSRISKTTCKNEIGTRKFRRATKGEDLVRGDVWLLSR
jgi:hypothetical protein